MSCLIITLYEKLRTVVNAHNTKTFNAKLIFVCFVQKDFHVRNFWFQKHEIAKTVKHCLFTEECMHQNYHWLRNWLLHSCDILFVKKASHATSSILSSLLSYNCLDFMPRGQICKLEWELFSPIELCWCYLPLWSGEVLSFTPDHCFKMALYCICIRLVWKWTVIVFTASFYIFWHPDAGNQLA